MTVTKIITFSFLLVHCSTLCCSSYYPIRFLMLHIFLILQIYTPVWLQRTSNTSLPAERIISAIIHMTRIYSQHPVIVIARLRCLKPLHNTNLSPLSHQFTQIIMSTRPLESACSVSSPAFYRMNDQRGLIPSWISNSEACAQPLLRSLWAARALTHILSEQLTLKVWRIVLTQSDALLCLCTTVNEH